VYLDLAEHRSPPDIVVGLYTHLVVLGEIPLWDGSRREFWFRWRLIKKFAVPAKLQELLLAGFQETRWPRRLDNPLPRPAHGSRAEGDDTAGEDYGKYLRDAIGRLNEGLKESPIRFGGDGSGEHVRWQVEKDPATRTGLRPG
jgi:hypothetical protein